MRHLGRPAEVAYRRRRHPLVQPRARTATTFQHAERPHRASVPHEPLRKSAVEQLRTPFPSAMAPPVTQTRVMNSLRRRPHRWGGARELFAVAVDQPSRRGLPRCTCQLDVTPYASVETSPTWQFCLPTPPPATLLPPEIPVEANPTFLPRSDDPFGRRHQPGPAPPNGKPGFCSACVRRRASHRNRAGPERTHADGPPPRRPLGHLHRRRAGNARPLVRACRPRAGVGVADAHRLKSAAAGTTTFGSFARTTARSRATRPPRPTCGAPS